MIPEEEATEAFPTWEIKTEDTVDPEEKERIQETDLRIHQMNTDHKEEPPEVEEEEEVEETTMIHQLITGWETAIAMTITAASQTLEEEQEVEHQTTRETESFVQSI